MAAEFCNATWCHHDRWNDPFWSPRASLYGAQTQEPNDPPVHDYPFYYDNDDRRLLIGEGVIRNDIQCGVDVGMIATNIANMGHAINSAVNSGSWIAVKELNSKFNHVTRYVYEIPRFLNYGNWI